MRTTERFQANLLMHQTDKTEAKHDSREKRSGPGIHDLSLLAGVCVERGVAGKLCCRQRHVEPMSMSRSEVVIKIAPWWFLERIRRHALLDSCPR